MAPNADGFDGSVMKWLESIVKILHISKYVRFFHENHGLLCHRAFLDLIIRFQKPAYLATLLLSSQASDLNVIHIFLIKYSTKGQSADDQIASTCPNSHSPHSFQNVSIHVE